MGTIFYRRTDTKIGRLMIASTETGLCCIALPGEPEDKFIDRLKKIHRESDLWDEDAMGEKSPINRKTREELLLYFNGKLKQFTVPLDMRGTDFQKKVWQQLLKIPYGKTASYGDIARAVGSPGASRAVGGASHKNPIPIVVPCHRVVGASGSLVGYGGGLKLKKALLDMESKI